MYFREPHKLDALFEGLRDSGVLGGFEDVVSPLKDYDRDHNSDLVRTLEVFFESNTNASVAAQRLYLHRNSLTYRLDRIQHVTGLDLTDPRTRLALQLGLLATRRARERKTDEPEHP